MTEIRHARFPEETAHVVQLFREYVTSASVSLAFQNYCTEFADLPGNYAPPAGCVLLAWKNGTVVGCAALRPVDGQVCEMKRVYVRPAARGENLGRRLVQRAIEEARNAGYVRVCLDVLPEFIAAQRLYESLGFRPAPPVSFNPVPGTKYLGLEL